MSQQQQAPQQQMDTLGYFLSWMCQQKEEDIAATSHKMLLQRYLGAGGPMSFQVWMQLWSQAENWEAVVVYVHFLRQQKEKEAVREEEVKAKVEQDAEAARLEEIEALKKALAKPKLVRQKKSVK